MTLTPTEIKNWEFRKAFRGYRTEDVDEFLTIVFETLEDFVREKERYR